MKLPRFDTTFICILLSLVLVSSCARKTSFTAFGNYKAHPSQVRITEFKVSQDTVCTGGVLIEFNKKGETVRESIVESDQKVSGTMEHQYDKNHNPIVTKLFMADTEVATVRYRYDNSGNEIWKSHESCGGSQRITTTEILKKKDTLVHTQFTEDGTFVSRAHHFTTGRIKVTKYTDITGKQTSRVETILDASENIINEKYFTKKGLSSETRYTYVKDKLIKEIRIRYKDGQIQSTDARSYTYDANGNIALQHTYKNDSLTGYSVYQYSYY